MNDITITVYLWLLTSINNFLPELLKIRPSVSAEWQIRQVRRIGRVRQVPRIRRVRVHIRRIRVLKIASMEVYVENPAVLELILLYRATKYKQTKRPGCWDYLWTSILSSCVINIRNFSFLCQYTNMKVSNFVKVCSNVLKETIWHYLKHKMQDQTSRSLNSKLPIK